jgi:hypothetical protein
MQEFVLEFRFQVCFLLAPHNSVKADLRHKTIFETIVKTVRDDTCAIEKCSNSDRLALEEK